MKTNLHENLLLDAAEAAGGDSESDPSPIDFKPLRRAYFVSLAVKAVNRIFLGGLIFGCAYLAGYGAGRVAGAYPTAAQIEQHLQQRKWE